MSGDTALPTVYYGGDPGPEDADRILVDGALQGALLIFNSLPPRLLGRFAASFLLSICMGSADPPLALRTITKTVGDTITFNMAKPGGISVSGLDPEIRRVWTMVEKIRAKQPAKPKHSPLPEAATEPDPTQIMSRSQRKAALLEIALANILYEVTHLSPEENDGSHLCKISAEAVHIAREALRSEREGADNDAPNPTRALARLFADEWKARRHHGDPYPNTLVSMEALGLIERVRMSAGRFADNYELTDLGKQALRLASDER